MGAAGEKKKESPGRMIRRYRVSRPCIDLPLSVSLYTCWLGISVRLGIEVVSIRLQSDTRESRQRKGTPSRSKCGVGEERKQGSFLFSSYVSFLTVVRLLSPSTRVAEGERSLLLCLTRRSG